MKKLDSSDIIAIVIMVAEFITTVLVTIFLAVWKPVPGGMIALGAVSALLGICLTLLAEEVATLKNEEHSIFNRAASNQDETPSSLQVFGVKISGYLLFSLQLILLFI